MDQNDRWEKLREELAELRERRDKLIGEAGEYAQEHNDLRENSAYLHTEQKIQLVDAQIHRIIMEFEKHRLKQKQLAYAKKSKKSLSN